MKNNITITDAELELIGLSQRDFDIYIALAKLGSAPLRRIAEVSGVSRSTVHDVLRKLMDFELVSFVDAQSHRYFTAEDPQQLRRLASRKELALSEARERIDRAIPEFQNLFGTLSYRPTVRYYEGPRGVKQILQDVLFTTEQTKTKIYRVYSSSGIRDLISQAWPRYNTSRKKKKINVKAIALGEGGETHGLDERKWLTQKQSAPTYIFIYGDKTAYVSADEKQRLFGVIIDDASIAQTQKMIFDQLWKHLG